MKKTVLISFLLLSCTLFYGQGTSYNLGFSQVLNLNFNLTNGNSNVNKWANAGTLTVPNNKTYKITSGSCYLVYSSTGNSVINTVSLKVGEHIIADNSATYSSQVYFPVWLSAGTYNVYMRTTSNSSGNVIGALTIVEFNIE